MANHYQSQDGGAQVDVGLDATASGGSRDGGGSGNGMVDAHSRQTPDGSAEPDDAQTAAHDASVSGGSLLDGEAPRGADAGVDTVACAGPCPASNIKYLVVIVQENHTFDDHFGRYCKAATGSNPTCTEGPACCEAAPTADPSGASYVDSESLLRGISIHDPDHTMVCELSEMNGGKMDRYAAGVQCSNPGNVMLANAKVIQPLWDLAARGALADRWFQPLVGQSSANDLYFARAQYGFSDNAFDPQGAVGTGCPVAQNTGLLSGTTIADLLQAAGVPWAFYAEGYAAAVAAKQQGTCSATVSGCPLQLPVYPCIYDPGDNPFQYFSSSQDKPESSRDFTRLANDLVEHSLPAVSFIKAIGFRSEHPGYGTRLTDGVQFVSDVVTAIEQSTYAPATLIVLTYDEGGGYFDHVTPPPDNPADNQPYGTRVPTLVLGTFAKKNYVSHVVMEHSSLVRFIEWNWLGQQTGQLAGRDRNVANLGSLLDPTTTGIAVPQ
ncbi:MAG: Acid phosphatase [Myxococcaceae bacterium]|nr:Acid phosphatase [Myxococcaceae bacterium]